MTDDVSDDMSEELRPEPRPLGLERIPTGHPGVDAALERLADADDLDVSGHPQVYEDVHEGLRRALAALDEAPTPKHADHRS
ncbi:hypothetical protein [Streptomyces sp. NPDC049555]|uniref:hypothetical protein n=1 Tax=unclassified Streptomyces TaxID=2593676 RepID=UPI0034182D1C